MTRQVLEEAKKGWDGGVRKGGGVKKGGALKEVPMAMLSGSCASFHPRIG